ncbi:MAG TPA: response regulator, partial [Pirellulales bacterium]
MGSTFTVTIPLGVDHLPPDRIDAARTLASTALAANSFVEEALHWLPAGSSDEDSVSRRERETTAPTPLRDGETRPYVVLADDNRDMRDYLQRLLAERYEVAAVCDGAEALATIRRRTPDLVLTDVMMPNLDGFGLLSRLRSDPRTQAVPIVMLSARAGEEARVEGLAAGADDYLTKPFSARELAARVAGTLALSRARQESGRQERRQTEQLQGLAEAAVAVNAALSVEDSLRLVVERARTIIGAHLGLSILQVDTLRKRVVSAVSRSVDYAQGRSFDVTPEEVGRCAVVVSETNKPLRRTAPELEADPDLRATPGEEDSRLPLRGVLGAPLVARDGHNMGLILLTDKQEGEFSEKDEAILVQFAQMASVAVENGQFFKAAQEARAEAEAANRMKDQFLATLSHELRTPLNAILGWARILQMGPFDAAALHEGLETIERNSKVQAQLIEDLLDLSRIISGKLRLDVQRVVLVDVIEAALAAVVPAAEAKQIRISRVLDPLAGPVSGDPARLQQIVWNLLSNAVKFTPAGGRIQVLLERVNSHVEISVSDTGQGVRPDFLPYVFDRFRQADASTTRRHGGLGLGLSIVRQLVEMHGGSVRAKSPGEG